MKVELAPGERLYVVFEDADGNVCVEYDWQASNKLRVMADYPDDTGREGEIYCEAFGHDGHEPEEPEDPAKVLRTVRCMDCEGDFSITAGEVAFMKKTFKGTFREPKRCPACRRKKKEAQAAAAEGE